MIEFLAIGSGVAFLVNRYVLGKKPETAQAPPPTHQVVGGIVLDHPIDPTTAKGVVYLLTSGTAAECETASVSLIRSGLPISARQCADRAASLRARERFQAAKAEREKREVDAEAERKAKLAAIEGKAKENDSAAAE